MGCIPADGSDRGAGGQQPAQGAHSGVRKPRQHQLIETESQHHPEDEASAEESFHAPSFAALAAPVPPNCAARSRTWLAPATAWAA